MAVPQVTQKQLEDRLSKTTVRRILDDDNDGSADTDPVTALLRDAMSKVCSYLGPIFDLDLIDPAQQPEVLRLTLDVAQAMAAQRHPEYMRVDGYKMMAQAEKDLRLLREGMTNLATKAPPEPAANQGVKFNSGNPLEPDKFPARFSDNWGGRGGF